MLSRVAWISITATLLAGIAYAQDPFLPNLRQCQLVRNAYEEAESFAKRCAERFVTTNGYTTVAVDDTSLVVPEALGIGDVHEALVRRRGTLHEVAITSDCSPLQCTVTFRYKQYREDCQFRRITMSRGFDHIRMEHQGVAAVGPDRMKFCPLIGSE